MLSPAIETKFLDSILHPFLELAKSIFLFRNDVVPGVCDTFGMYRQLLIRNNSSWALRSVVLGSTRENCYIIDSARFLHNQS